MSSTHGPDRRRSRGRYPWPAARELPPLQSTSRDPLKQVYQGRWRELPTLHKVGVVIVLVPVLVFACVVFGWPLMHTEGWEYLAKIVLVVGGLLVCLFLFRKALFSLIKYLRTSKETERSH
jgi:hypothetical protein